MPPTPSPGPSAISKKTFVMKHRKGQVVENVPRCLLYFSLGGCFSGSRHQVTVYYQLPVPPNYGSAIQFGKEQWCQQRVGGQVFQISALG